MSNNGQLTKKQQEELQARVRLFDQEFREIQEKYKLKVLAQVVFPGGAVLSVPITVAPIDIQPAPAEEQATKPD